MQDPVNKSLPIKCLMSWRKPPVSGIVSTQLQGPGELGREDIGVERKQCSFCGWSVSIKRVCVWTSEERSEVYIAKKFLASCLEHCSEILCSQQQGIHQTALGAFPPSQGVVRLRLSSSESGGSCSSRGAHALLVDRRISLLLFSWPLRKLSDPCDFSAILGE